MSTETKTTQTLEQTAVQDAYLNENFKDAEKDPENLLVVKNLKKYFPIFH